MLRVHLGRLRRKIRRGNGRITGTLRRRGGWRERRTGTERLLDEPAPQRFQRGRTGRGESPHDTVDEVSFVKTYVLQ